MAVPFLSACTEADVLPSQPPIMTPNPPSNLRVVELLRAVMLIWDAPQTNTDGSPLTDLQSYQIFRKSLPNGEFAYLYEVERSGTVFVDTRVGGNEVVYKVVAKTSRGAQSDDSESSPSARAQMKIRSTEVPPIGTRSLFEAHGNRVTEPTDASVSVERLSEHDFLSLELICTHAGCDAMNWDGKNWTCRCHGSRFDNFGNVIQPPATTPLLRLTTIQASNGDLILRAFE